MDDLSQATLVTLAADLRAGRLNAVEIAERALANMRYGAYVEVDRDRTIQAAREADQAFEAGTDLGPLQGIPISVKDLFGVPGYRTGAGSPRPLPPRFEAPGPVVGAALRQRAVVTGKTHTVEFAFGGVGTNPHHPTPRNPCDREAHRAPGGSTAGGGISLCEGSAFLALGTDTAGSVRIPAAWTGNAALKTTKGRWSTAGIVPLSPTLDTAGILARNVEDLCLGFQALDPTSPGLPAPPDPASLRLARCDELFFEECSPGVVETVEAALKTLTDGGGQLTSVELPELRPTYELFKKGGPVSVELYHFLSTQLPHWLESLDPNVRQRIGVAAELRAHQYLERLHQMRRRAASVANKLRRFDVLVSPTVANTPPKLGDIATPETYGPQNLLALRNTSLASYLGLCAVTVPAGRDAEGMPVGLQLIARGGGDERLLSIALVVERALRER